MDEKPEFEEIPGYISIKKVAKALGVSDKRIYAFIDQGRLRALKAGGGTAIPIEDFEKFQRHITGRPRKHPPAWRIPPADNRLRALLIEVQIRPGQEDNLTKRLKEIRQAKDHLFPGTIARYIGADDGRVEMYFVWRGVSDTNEEEIERDLEAFRRALADVLDWNTARYHTTRMLMYT